MMRRSIVRASIAFALVVACAAIAVAVTRDSGRSHKVDTAAAASRTTTSTSEPSSTTTAASDAPPDDAPTTSLASTPETGAPTRSDQTAASSPPTTLQAADLAATVAATRTTLLPDQPMDFTLTLRNVTNHEVVYTGEPRLGLMVAFDGGGYEYAKGPPDFRLAAGDERSFTLSWTPHPSDVGPARVSGVVITMAGYGDRPNDYPVIISGAEALPITVVPPGWVEGQPLDPTQGKWTVAISGDSLIVHAGEPAIVHTTVRNVGEQAQKTRGYGALAVSCRQWNVRRPPAYEVHGLVDATVIPAGANRTFSVEILIDKQFAGQLACRAGIFFHATPNDYVGVIANVNALLRFVVRPPLRTTTTSAPATTTTLP